ncbi:FAD-dependent oxidoreductase [Alcaligenaceae bacterium]|nr:FAD-dependent oxidoreductase [Alcaligenaceae bacterium]
MTALLPVIIGAGPAGLRAAAALVEAGLRPVLLDESPAAGGQIYRQPPVGFRRSRKSLYGFEHRKAASLHALGTRLQHQLDYRPGVLVWNAQDGVVSTLAGGHVQTVPYTHLIVATGATDRVLPFPGWLTPGVYTLGGSQVALKYQGCSIGKNVVFAGTGPLLYLVAYQYAKAGARVAAVLDTARATDRRAALPGLLRAPALLAKGLYYMGWLKAHGVPIKSGVQQLEVLGVERVEGITWTQQGQSAVHELACDGVGFGYALRSETQLADLLGCRFSFNEPDRAWLPERDAYGRASKEGVYLAGDGASIGGADAAELGGELAAYALLQDLGFDTSTARTQQLLSQRAATSKVRRALDHAFPFPEDWAAQADDDTVICRCEEIRVGQLREAIRFYGVSEINRLKAVCRVGMGRCQGRVCGVAAIEVLAHETGMQVAQVGRMRAQAPIKPVPISAFETSRVMASNTHDEAMAEQLGGDNV